MSEKNNKQELSEKEIKEQKAVERENKLLRFLLPIVGAVAFLLGLLGFILTIFWPCWSPLWSLINYP